MDLSTLREKMDKSLELAKANGLSEMTMEEIIEEIAQYRKEKRARLAAEKASDEMDKLWEVRGWTNETMKAWLKESNH